ncbi:MAG: hypothetical protein N3G21_05540 [Candidatus Hydrogenedentes bacterium]|nr:hypothetical protein [Candidatus Hydrogenedentota bacterium]
MYSIYEKFVLVFLFVVLFFSIWSFAETDLKISQTIGGEGYISNGNKYTPGKDLVVEVEFIYTGSSTVTALGLVTEVPQQCSFVSLVSGALPPIYPSGGTRGRFEFAWIFIPNFPFKFSFKINVEEGYTSPLAVTSYGMYRTDGPNITTESVVANLVCVCDSSEGSGEGVNEGGIEGTQEGEGVAEGEGEGGFWFDPCNIDNCLEVGCNSGEVSSSFESDLRWFYELFGEDPDKADLDGNRVLDVAQAWILDGVLSRWDMGIYCCVVATYVVNLDSAKLYADEIAASQPVIFLIVDRARFERVVAGIMTVGERSTVEMLVGMIDELPLEVPLPNMALFNVSSSCWLSMYGDADMDGVCNLGEYRYAMDSSEGLEGYKRRVLSVEEFSDGGGCVWCGEGESPYEGEGVLEGILEGEGEGIIEGEGEDEVFASLTVIIEPEEAVISGAQWKIEGDEAWRSSGESVTGLSAGVYRVFFYQPQGWVYSRYLDFKNDYIDVEIDSGENKVVVETFIKVGELMVSIFPPDAVNKGAKWRPKGFELWRNSKEVVILEMGWVEIEFTDVDGYIKPQSLKVYIPFASRLALDVSYKKSVALTEKEKRNFALLLWSTFSYCDIDGDGYLSYEEVVERYPQIPIDLLLEIDKDRDGKISREELEEYLKNITGVKCGCNSR